MVPAADHTLPAKIPPGNAPGGSRKLMGPLRHILVTFVWLSQSLRWDLWVGRGISGSTTTHHTTDDGSAWLMAALCSGKNRERPLRSDPSATSSTRKRLEASRILKEGALNLEETQPPAIAQSRQCWAILSQPQGPRTAVSHSVNWGGWAWCSLKALQMEHMLMMC